MGRLYPSTSETSYQSKPSEALRVNSATVAGGTPVPLWASQSSPPLQPTAYDQFQNIRERMRNGPPVRQEFGPGLVEKSQFLRPQIRPALQLSGRQLKRVTTGDRVTYQEQ
jgi:hypothetical protein